MPREKYQTRLPADTAAEVEEYIDENEISQSEAIRRLVETGLEVERDDGEILDTRNMATANITDAARVTGGGLIGLMVFLLLLLEVGLL
jgi:metal-responsive CopG/Arc/MetJ family transcriptional regulator